MPRARSASSTLAPAESQGNRAGSWNIIAIWPDTAMLPVVGLSRPANSDSIVDLQHPDAPLTEGKPPGATERDTWSRAWTAADPRPYTLETPASVTADVSSVTVLVVISVALISVVRTGGSGAHGRLAGGGQQRVELRQVVYAAQRHLLPEQAEGL